MKRTTLRRRTPMPRHPAARRPALTDPVPAFDPERRLAELRAGMGEQQTRAALPREFRGPVADPVAAVRPKDDGTFSEATRALIIFRDLETCQCCGAKVGWSIPFNLQHRSARQMGGTNDPIISNAANGLVLCGSPTTGCHGWVEGNSEEAEKAGYAVPSWADPSTCPVLNPDHLTWSLLNPDGTRTPCPAPPLNDSRSVANRRH